MTFDDVAPLFFPMPWQSPRDWNGWILVVQFGVARLGGVTLVDSMLVPYAPQICIYDINNPWFMNTIFPCKLVHTSCNWVPASKTVISHWDVGPLIGLPQGLLFRFFFKGFVREQQYLGKKQLRTFPWLICIQLASPVFSLSSFIHCFERFMLLIYINLGSKWHL